MKLENIKQVFLLGIGGIGMSGLARYFHKMGCEVAGYDKTETPLTMALAAEGISVFYQDEVKLIPDIFLSNNPNVLVIYTPAVPQSATLCQFFTKEGYIIKKRSQVLGILSEGLFTIAVAGTHGKTTTSCLIAHMLKNSGNDCAAFLGGISSNYQTNVLFGSNNVLVVEADEFDRSFLTLHPDIAVITSMDADHLDIYGDESHLIESFKLFASQVKEGGKLIRKNSLPLTIGQTYGIQDEANSLSFNLRVENGVFVFDYKTPNVLFENLQLGLPGQHNIENATAAIEVCLLLGLNETQIREGLKTFKGVKRRFEYQLQSSNCVYIDDYAHHPEELRACIKAVRTLYPDKKLTAVFQPHLFTRTRDFADDFANVLGTVDDLVLLEIYPARELPIHGVDSTMLLNKINLTQKRILAKQQTLDYIGQIQPELLLTLGAGDIDTLVSPIKNILENA